MNEESKTETDNGYRYIETVECNKKIEYVADYILSP